MLRPRTIHDPFFCHLCPDMERASYMVGTGQTPIAACTGCVARLAVVLSKLSVEDLTHALEPA